MAKAKKAKQLIWTMENKVGQLYEVAGAVANARVNIEAICAREDGEKAIFIMVTDSNVKAKKVLQKLGVEPSEEEVILCEMSNRPGELQKVAEKIASAGINISYMYGTAGRGKSSVCIFKTADDKKVIKLINK